MPASPADSALYRGLFGDDEAARLFTDSAEVRAMLLVEGALARVQGRLGMIPADAAAFIERAAMEVALDPSALAASVAVNGVPVPGLVAAFRKASGAPEFAGYVHWGATSQDIMDTALVLRLRRLFDLWDGRIAALLAGLAVLAERHADLPMAARTYGQAATPTTFGAVVAAWGRPLLRHRARLAALRGEVLRVSLAGAAGTLSAMGPQGPKVRAALAAELGLADPGVGWHAEREGIAALGAWMAGVTGSLAKMGEDLILLCQTGIGEVVISGAGGSSTMPQKQNPVGPSVLVALARQVAALAGVLSLGVAHRQQRDGAAWFGEWLALPQACILTSRALGLAVDLCGQVAPVPEAMARGLAQGGGTIYAEALVFLLAQDMPRPEAAERVAGLCAQAVAGGGDLRDLARAAIPGLDLASLDGPAAVGCAPDEARDFARAAWLGIATDDGDKARPDSGRSSN